MSSLNTLRSQVNEILLGHYIVNGWSKFNRSDEVKACLQKRRETLSRIDYDTQDQRAFYMAQAVKRFVSDSRIKSVYWTANAGELQRALGDDYEIDKGNPTDILLKFSDNSYLGVSAKSIQSSYHHHISVKNPGLGTIEKQLNIDLSTIKTVPENQFIELHRLSPLATERRKQLADNRYIRAEAYDIASEILTNMRDELYEELLQLSQAQLKQHIKQDWLNSHKDVFPNYIIVAGHPNRVTLDIPTNKRLKEISIEKRRRNTIGIYAGNERLLQIRFKYVSMPLASSIKMCGHYW